MKKVALLSTVFLCIALLLSSCTTVQSGNTEFSGDEAAQAIKNTINRAIERTNPRFIQKLSSCDFVPQEYRFFEEKTYIPGMNKLITTWNQYVNSYIAENAEIIEITTKDIAKDLLIEDADALVKKSNTSASELLEMQFGNAFKEILYDIFDKMDYRVLEDMVNQYNAWVDSQNYKNGTHYSNFIYKDCKNELTNTAFELYKSTLQMFEELLRTTPDPYTDEISKKVFGIN